MPLVGQQCELMDGTPFVDEPTFPIPMRGNEKWRLAEDGSHRYVPNPHEG